jgi:folate-dependent phosphoribosylglycinamide formyltransferase PurN
MRFGIIAAENGLLDAHVVAAILEHALLPEIVLLDEKPISERDRQLVAARTAGRLPQISWDDLALPPGIVTRVLDHNGADAVTRAQAARLDWIVNAGTPRILTVGMLDAARHGVLNCHPGLLPAFRGSSAVEWAILLDEPVGNSVHVMTPGIDEGPILATRATPVPPDAGYVDIRVAVYRDGFALLAQTLEGIAAGRIRPEDAAPQAAGRYFRPIDPKSIAAMDRRLERGAYRGMTQLGATPLPVTADSRPAKR